GVGERLADLLGGAPPQQMHADGADGDRRQHKGRYGAADAEAHAGVLVGGWLPQYGTIPASVSATTPIQRPGHSSVTGVGPQRRRNLPITCSVPAKRALCLAVISKVMQCTMYPSRRP